MNKVFVFLFSVLLFLSGCVNNKESGNSNNSDKDSTIFPLIEHSPKPIVNVYIENSGSMFGYVKDGSGNDFDRSISSLLTQMTVSGYTDSLNMSYINSDIFHIDVDIPTFIKDITKTSEFQGNLGSTDMCELFDAITSTADVNNVSIMVSDCIFSPGRGVNAMNYIGAEKDCITLKLHDKVKSRDLAFVVYRMISNFKGTYYDCEDNRTTIDNDRPYFIWIVGTKENIAEFNKKGIEDKIEGRLENSYTIFNSEDKASYAVQYNPKIGDFKRDNPHKISNARADNYSRKLLFTVSADFSSLLLDNDYLTNPDNYLISNSNYNIEIDKNNNPNNNFTHDIRISTESNIITKTTLSINLINQIPEWIEQYSDDECTHINSKGMMEKTYGLKHLVDGIYSAYNFKNNVLTELEIEIN